MKLWFGSAQPPRCHYEAQVIGPLHVDEADVTELDAFRKREKERRQGGEGGHAPQQVLQRLPFLLQRLLGADARDVGLAAHVAADLVHLVHEHQAVGGLLQELLDRGVGARCCSSRRERSDDQGGRRARVRSGRGR